MTLSLLRHFCYLVIVRLYLLDSFFCSHYVRETGECTECGSGSVFCREAGQQEQAYKTDMRAHCGPCLILKWKRLTMALERSGKCLFSVIEFVYVNAVFFLLSPAPQPLSIPATNKSSK